MIFFNFLKDFYIVFKYKVIEPEYSLPISLSTALFLKKESIKLRFFKNQISYIKIKIDNIKTTTKTNIVFSSFFKKESLLKYENYDILIKDVRSLSKFNEEDFIKIEDMELLGSIDNIKEYFKVEKNNNVKEYLIDYIYKNKTEYLNDLKIQIFSEENFYIRNYYKKLMEYYFNYLDYNTLVSIYSEYESLFISNNEEVNYLKNILIELIQEKNLIEESMSELNL